MKEPCGMMDNGNLVADKGGPTILPWWRGEYQRDDFLLRQAYRRPFLISVTVVATVDPACHMSDNVRTQVVRECVWATNQCRRCPIRAYPSMRVVRVTLPTQLLLGASTAKYMRDRRARRGSRCQPDYLCSDVAIVHCITYTHITHFTGTTTLSNGCIGCIHVIVRKLSNSNLYPTVAQTGLKRVSIRCVKCGQKNKKTPRHVIIMYPITLVRCHPSLLVA